MAKPRRPGRPPAAGKARTERISARVTPEEHRTFLRRVAQEGVAAAELARRMFRYALKHMPRGWDE